MKKKIILTTQAILNLKISFIETELILLIEIKFQYKEAAI